MRASPFEFEQVGQQLGVLLHVEHEARHVPPGRLSHEGFAPEAEQGLATAAMQAVREASMCRSVTRMTEGMRSRLHQRGGRTRA